MIDFSSSNEGTWFLFNEENKEAGGICLRELGTEEAARIEKLTIKHKRKPVRGVVVDVIEENSKLATRLTWDYCIVAWKNIQLDGKEVECNTENKVKLMGCTDFAKFMGDCITELVETNKTLEEARAKNSMSSSSGKHKNQAVTTASNSTKIPEKNPPVTNAS